MAGGVVAEEGVVLFLFFGGEEGDAGGCEAVGAGVPGGAGFAFGGDGAVGPGSVDASGVAMSLTDGGHRFLLWPCFSTRRFSDLWVKFASGWEKREKYLWIDGERGVHPNEKRG
jgi:hypothetical protein